MRYIQKKKFIKFLYNVLVFFVSAGVLLLFLGILLSLIISAFFFFFNDTATTEIYTLSLHDALRSLLRRGSDHHQFSLPVGGRDRLRAAAALRDRKSTRLNSSHANNSYAVFCLKKKKIATQTTLVKVQNDYCTLK